MKKIVYLVVTLLIVCASAISILAWTAPTISTKYAEEDVEFRSVWVCTVSNMDVDKQKGTDEAAINQWKEQYLTILENSKAMGMNAIIFQVRPNNDAFYPSRYNPWSEFLVGFGVDPGWDPLEWMIEVTHAAGLEYHAWLNPYRASVSALEFNITQSESGIGSFIGDYNKDQAAEYKHRYFANKKNICIANNTLVDNPIFSDDPSFSHDVLYGSEEKFILNPASEVTIRHLENTVLELIDNYDIDGIHFDDYFYPDDKNYRGTVASLKGYTYSCEPDVDQADYHAFLDGGGVVEGDPNLSPELNAKRAVYDWRRSNVNNLIERLATLIREHNKTDKFNCAFGISPAARWAPNVEYCDIRGATGGMGGSGDCNNYYSYSDLYADVYKWVKEGWLDYILPQVYTYLGTSEGGFPTGYYDTLTKWWSNAVVGTGVKLYIGTPIYQVASWSRNGYCTNMEMYYQIRWNQFKKYNVDGYVMFRYESFVEGVGYQAMNQVRQYLWKKAALTPIYDSYEYDHLEMGATIKELKGNTSGNYSLYFDDVEGGKAYGILENGVLIARVLKGTGEISFSPTSTESNFTFVTYGYDNERATQNQDFDFSILRANQAPTAALATTIDDEYTIGSKINLKYNVEDLDGDSFNYEIVCRSDRRDYRVGSGNTTTGEIEVNYEMLSITATNLRFVIILNDGFGDVEYESKAFNIVEKTSSDEPSNPDPTDDPTPPDDGDDPVEPVTPAKPKKKCGKKNAAILILSLSLSIALLIFFRRRK